MDMYTRMDNGVKARADGAGDAWAQSHRTLGRDFHMHDIDVLFGLVAFGQNTGERLFLEYVPDNYQNRTSVIRKFAAVAMFDRKASTKAAFSQQNALSTAQYLWQCRTLGEGGNQPLMPKFFFVIGKQTPPWEMIEIDIYTGERTGVEELIFMKSQAEWQRVWDALGLTSLRNELRQWVDPQGAQGRR